MRRTRREQLILFLGLTKPLLFADLAEFADFGKPEKRPTIPTITWCRLRG